MAQVTMPKMSDTMEEGTIVQWLKHEGDPISEGEPIAEIETDKANVEMEAFESGVLGKILKSEGEIVAVGEPIASIEAPGAAPAAEAKPEAPKAEAPAPKAEVPQAPAAAPPPAQALEQPAPGKPAPETTPAPPPTPAAPAVEEERIKVSPLARRMAEERGIDLSQVQGSGPNGRIVESDIEKYAAQKGAASQPPEAPAPPEPATEAPPVKAAAPTTEVPYEEYELSRMRKTIADRMTHSKQTIPHFYATIEVEMDWATRVRDELNADEQQPKISFNDIVIKACALALTEFPRANASVYDSTIRTYKQVNIGMAVAIEDGLIVPVVHDADKKHLREIAAETKQLAQHARDNQLRMHEYVGSTFTVTNLGMFGVEEFASVINPPESASMAVGAIQEVPVVSDGQVTVSRRMKLTISADHRAMDGAEAARFLQVVKHRLETPIGLL